MLRVVNSYIYLIAVKNGAVSVQNGVEMTVLPGGACETQEPHEAFLMRYCLEQVGADINVEDFVCEETDGERREFFYCGSVLEQVTEQSLLTELPLTQLRRLSVSTQRRAVEKCLAMLRDDAHGADEEPL